MNNAPCPPVRRRSFCLHSDKGHLTEPHFQCFAYIEGLSARWGKPFFFGVNLLNVFPFHSQHFKFHFITPSIHLLVMDQESKPGFYC